ncbi:hypothetical protein L227DRAFT_60520 [Lentinus tigrinus ALCF2SS1-6]|uniref:Uncharacterized protein n=1 Tax=Lentinus tigrinus ALCF2SS1-6 TaxID=1328759 RepID=A0A5C2SDC0_9APHY|nr:hypothetical protein L227DRAFT_60520 [Lentinus tigrinus ALCF2SS1-6]
MSAPECGVASANGLALFPAPAQPSFVSDPAPRLLLASCTTPVHSAGGVPSIAQDAGQIRQAGGNRAVDHPPTVSPMAEHATFLMSECRFCSWAVVRLCISWLSRPRPGCNTGFPPCSSSFRLAAMRDSDGSTAPPHYPALYPTSIPIHIFHRCSPRSLLKR